jgi:hypothetical protein
VQLENMLGDIQADENDLGHSVNHLVLDIPDIATTVAKEASTWGNRGSHSPLDPDVIWRVAVPR